MELVGQEEIDLLNEYADLDGTEVGEACMMLIQMHRCGTSYGFSEDFMDAVEAEILNFLHDFQNNYVIEEREIPVPTMKVRELVPRVDVEDE